MSRDLSSTLALLRSLYYPCDGNHGEAQRLRYSSAHTPFHTVHTSSEGSRLGQSASVFGPNFSQAVVFYAHCGQSRSAVPALHSHRR